MSADFSLSEQPMASYSFHFAFGTQPRSIWHSTYKTVIITIPITMLVISEAVIEKLIITMLVISEVVLKNS